MKKFYVKNIDDKGKYLVLTLQPRRQRDALGFYPGQYATIGFKIEGRPSPMRCFSMVSSPNNPDELQFAMRVQGDFTKAIHNLRVGEEVSLQGPYGDFVIDPAYDRNIIMLAGGIGITPFMSMLQYVAETDMAVSITLAYACRSQSNIPFYDDIVALQKRNPRLRVVFFINDGNITPQQGVTLVAGRIDEARLGQLTGERYSNFSYFICGPDGFRNGLETVLVEKEVHPSRILTESFNQISKVGGPFGISIPSITYLVASLGLVLLIGFIMTLDLSRNVSRVGSAPSSTISVSPTAVTPSNTNTASDTTQNAPTSNNSSNTSNNTPYQAPVSSVS